MEEITLLNTVLIKWDGSGIICPNASLAAAPLTNVTRSQKKGEVFKVPCGAAAAALILPCMLRGHACAL